MSHPNFTIQDEGEERLPLAEFRHRDQIRRGLEMMQYAAGTMAKALDELQGYGFITRTGNGAATGRVMAASGDGLTVTHGDGVAGNPTIAAAHDLAALEALTGSSVLPRRTGPNTWDTVPVNAFGVTLLALHNVQELLDLLQGLIVSIQPRLLDIDDGKYYPMYCSSKDEEGNERPRQVVIGDTAL